jgi:hypothetical protein
MTNQEDQMKKLLTVILCTLATRLYAAESTLDSWAENIANPQIQQEILNKIFPGQIGPVAAGVPNKSSVMILLPKGGNWVQLAKDPVWSPAEGPMPAFLAVSALYYNRPDREPATAASYLFRDTQRKPAALSAGYSNYEKIEKIELPRLRRVFLLLTSASGRPDERQWSASLLEMRPNQLDRPKPAWVSPAAIRQFQVGFDPMNRDTEMLLLRTRKGGDIEYIAYAYRDGRFEQDDFVFDTRLMTMPESVWKYGAPSAPAVPGTSSY